MPTRRLAFLFRRGLRTLVLASAACLVGADSGSGQEESGRSEFAPGVLTTIAPEIDRRDAIHLHEMIEVRADPQLKWTPTSIPPTRTLFEMAEEVAFLQGVWCLEFAFKPLRMIEVDLPDASGRVTRKLVWYMVYRVRNTGDGVVGEVNAEGEFETVDKVFTPIRFQPQFVLSSHDRDNRQRRVRKAYLDRVLPAAVGPIQRRERIGGKLYTSVEMAQQQLAVEKGRLRKGLWGVATWEDIDPQIDFFSVFVGGLTNAYRWKDSPEAFQAGDPPGKGRTFTRRKLQLNFWRPGDQYAENEREIRFGVPEENAGLYESGEGVAYRWVYR